jgi:hypothetical protein
MVVVDNSGFDVGTFAIQGFRGVAGRDTDEYSFGAAGAVIETSGDRAAPGGGWDEAAGVSVDEEGAGVGAHSKIDAELGPQVGAENSRFV